jgi:phage FluMu protein Com
MTLHNLVNAMEPRRLMYYDLSDKSLPNADEVHAEVICPDCGKVNSVYSWNLITASMQYSDEKDTDMRVQTSIYDAMNMNTAKKQYYCPSCNACNTVEKIILNHPG